MGRGKGGGKGGRGGGGGRGRGHQHQSERKLPAEENNNKNNKQYQAEENNNKNRKQHERQTRRNMKQERKRRQYGDAEWKREFDLFLEQLKIIGLTIKDVAGDGNCLFRAMADQMDGNPDNHPKFRKTICEYIEKNRFDFEPFIEDDEPFEVYMVRMKRNATWGGQMEIQACSLAYGINITIHQLGQPRWDIINFPASQVKTIHLSYHQGEHYSSVRKIGDFTMKHVAPKEIKLESKLSPRPSKEEEKKVFITDEERKVMEFSGCQNWDFVKIVLEENYQDIDSTVEFILTVGADNFKFQNEFLQDHKFETKSNKNNNSTSTTTKTTTTTTTTTKTTNITSSDTPETNGSERNEKKKNSNQKKETFSEKENQPITNIHPKLAKFHESKLSNRERQEKARTEKLAIETSVPTPIPTPVTHSSNTEVTDEISPIVKDLGSMQI